MPNVTLYHNPNCSKSRQALALLTSAKLNPTLIHYLDTPPDVEQLQQLCQQLQKQPADLLRRHETMYTTLQLDHYAADAIELLKAIANHPELLQRPIVVIDQRAIIARPPERLHAFI